jgi:hypothetical protein
MRRVPLRSDGRPRVRETKMEIPRTKRVASSTMISQLPIPHARDANCP